LAEPLVLLWPVALLWPWPFPWTVPVPVVDALLWPVVMLRPPLLLFLAVFTFAAFTWPCSLLLALCFAL
jgi:hypothetical protein